MLKRLPSVASLQAFEAAGRQLSFTSAGVELGITQGAVSQRIASLEILLGGKLFRREGNSISLTGFGENFINVARDLLVRLGGATEKIVEENRGDRLSIGCLAGFGMKIVLPKLYVFRKHHPEISLRVRMFAPNEDVLDWRQRPDNYNLGLQKFDIYFHYGSGEWPGMHTHHIRDEYVFPVCSPSYTRGRQCLRKVEDLAGVPVILTSDPITGYNHWRIWLEEFGQGGLSFSEEIFCDPLFAAQQAAVEGLGVLMGRSSLVRQDIESGLLVKPFSFELKTRLSYYLLVSQERRDTPKIRSFLKWSEKNF